VGRIYRRSHSAIQRADARGAKTVGCGTQRNVGSLRDAMLGGKTRIAEKKSKKHGGNVRRVLGINKRADQTEKTRGNARRNENESKTVSNQERVKLGSFVGSAKAGGDKFGRTAIWRGGGKTVRNDNRRGLITFLSVCTTTSWGGG